MSTLLVLDAGSSSLKFAAFDAGLRELCSGQLEGLGAAPHLLARGADGRVLAERRWDGAAAPETHEAALEEVIGLLEREVRAVAAVGHRVVHGGPRFAAPVLVDDAVLAALRELVPLAPLHQPHNLAGIAAAQRHFPGVPQVACFDTAFHRTQSFEAEAFALPRRFYEQGIRRYGFHGLSYEYIARLLAKENAALAAGRVVVAHLGNGASLCGMLGGRSQATTMGFTALDGVPMGTRSGQLDPGVVLHMLDALGMTTQQVTQLLYRESGLKGLSGLSQDMRVLEAAGTPAAEQAIGHFAFRIRQAVGALAAGLGGLDALLFTAGIGEHSAALRARVCAGLEFLGITLDAARNAGHAPEISAEGARVRVLVRHTDEERMIAEHVQEALAAAGQPLSAA